MARQYARKRGRSGSTRPISKRAPSWGKYTPEEVEALIMKFAKEGMTASRIGLILRDQYGVPLTSTILGRKLGRVIESAGYRPGMPEDLDSLLRKADRVKRHLEKNKADSRNKRSLALIESKIHNLSEYYKRKGVLPESWRYKTAVAAVV
ncbi:MAG: 30S ribosomal protein S15 [Candidatus Bathyarchaeia archaeon]